MLVIPKIERLRQDNFMNSGPARTTQGESNRQTNKQKYLNENLTKEVKYLYVENYKMLMKEFVDNRVEK